MSAYEDICYRFDERTAYPRGEEVAAVYAVLGHQTSHWRTVFGQKKARLSFEEDGAGVVIRDSRFTEDETVYRLPDVCRSLCAVLFGGMHTKDVILGKMQEQGYAESAVTEALDELCTRRVVVSEESRYVLIAFPQAFYESGGAVSWSESTVDGLDVKDPQEWLPRSDVA